MITELVDNEKSGNTSKPAAKQSRETDSLYILRLFSLSREKTPQLVDKKIAKPHSFGLYSNLGQCYEPATADDYMG